MSSNKSLLNSLFLTAITVCDLKTRLVGSFLCNATVITKKQHKTVIFITFASNIITYMWFSVKGF